MIIAIDGPAASGKTTIASLLANKLNFIHLNSGLFYRAITYIIKDKGYAEITPQYVNEIEFKVTGENLDSIIYNKTNISHNLNNEKINKSINKISNHPDIRKKLVSMQRKLVKNRDVVCEGRDIGSVVFPNAEFKFFLNANLDDRVNRRYGQLKVYSKNIIKSKIRETLVLRDSNDMNRQNSPLKKVSDCIEINNSNLTIEEQVEYMHSIIKKGKYDK